MSSLYTNSRLRIKKNTVLHIRRSFISAKCKINVKVGQEVCPSDVLGEGHENTGFTSLSLTKELGVSPEKVPAFLKCRIGQTIYKGELLAEKPGMFSFSKKLILAPGDGIIDLYDERRGIMRIKIVPKANALMSGVYGIIEQITPSTGSVVIKTLANIVYGLSGAGREKSGLIKVLGASDMLVGSKHIISEYKGKILVGGSMVFLEGLHEAVQQGVGGIISGGINAADYRTMVGQGWNILNKRWLDVGLTAMITEGFGAIPIGEDIFESLIRHNNKFAILDGNRARLILPSDEPDSMIYIREAKLEKISRVETEPGVEITELKEGLKVRLVAMPFVGKQGIIDRIDAAPTVVPSGISTIMVTVATKSQKIRVPYLNLEAIR